MRTLDWPLMGDGSKLQMVCRNKRTCKAMRVQRHTWHCSRKGKKAFGRRRVETGFLPRDVGGIVVSRRHVLVVVRLKVPYVSFSIQRWWR